MPWPIFTELTFGFAFLKEFELHYVQGGRFPKAPEFISQRDEAGLGYDVMIRDNTTPVYIQLKRSFVIEKRNAKEIRDETYSDTYVYRMYLYKKTDTDSTGHFKT